MSQLLPQTRWSLKSCKRPVSRVGNRPLSCGGAEGIRTPDLFHAMEARYQLRQSPAVSCDSESLADEGLQRKIGSLVGLVRYATPLPGSADGRV